MIQRLPIETPEALPAGIYQDIYGSDVKGAVLAWYLPALLLGVTLRVLLSRQSSSHVIEWDPKRWSEGSRRLALRILGRPVEITHQDFSSNLFVKSFEGTKVDKVKTRQTVLIFSGPVFEPICTRHRRSDGASKRRPREFLSLGRQNPCTLSSKLMSPLCALWLQSSLGSKNPAIRQQ